MRATKRGFICFVFARDEGARRDALEIGDWVRRGHCKGELFVAGLFFGEAGGRIGLEFHIVADEAEGAVEFAVALRGVGWWWGAPSGGGT